MLTVTTTVLFFIALALAALRHLRDVQRRERRLQSRLIRALHVEFGAGSGHLFRPRTMLTGPRGLFLPRRAG